MRETEPLSIDSIVVRIDRTMDAEVNDEIVALNLDTAASYGLNDRSAAGLPHERLVTGRARYPAGPERMRTSK